MRARRRRLLTVAAIVVAVFGSAFSQTASDGCLTCHGGAAGPTIRRIGSHVYGVDYEAARTRRRSLRPSGAPSGFGSTIANDLLMNGRVECTTCHTPHEQPNGNAYRLRYGKRFAELCTGCHDPTRL